MNKLVVWFVKITGFIPQVFAFRKKIYYEDKKSQSRRIKGKAIVVSNHTDLMDFAVLIYVFFCRTLRTLTAEVVYGKNKFSQWLVTRLGAVKVDRSSHDFAFMTEMNRLLDKGCACLVFPEGRLPTKEERASGELMRFAPSFMYVALESGAPIIPVYTNGVYGKKERTKIIIGKKIYPSDLYDSSLSEKENIERLTELVKEKIADLGKQLESKTNGKV